MKVKVRRKAQKGNIMENTTINLTPEFCPGSAVDFKEERSEEGVYAYSDIPVVMELAPEELQMLSAIVDFGEGVKDEEKYLGEVLESRLEETLVSSGHIRIAKVKNLVRGSEYPNLVREIARMEKDIVMNKLYDELESVSGEPLWCFIRTIAAGDIRTGKVIKDAVTAAEGHFSFTSPCIFSGKFLPVRSYPADADLSELFSKTNGWVIFRVEYKWLKYNIAAEKALLRSIFGEEN